MNTMSNSWAVVATVSEPGPLVAAMAAHHISLGASEIHLYLDKPDAQVRALLAPLRQVRFVECDDAYWRGKRPEQHTVRQGANANHAYRRTRADWLLHCDADEFTNGAGPLAEALAAVPAELDCVRLRNVERVVLQGRESPDLFEGPFRRPFVPGTARTHGPEIYGEMNRFLNFGLTGHRAGKMLTRTGRGHRIMIHRSGHAVEGKIVELPYIDLPDHLLLHYDGITPLHYLAKMLRHMDVESAADRPTWPASRVAQVLEARRLKADGPAMLRFVERLRQISPRQAALLRDQGLLVEAAVSPTAALRTLCPEAEVDARGFDALLRQRESALLEGAYLST